MRILVTGAAQGIGAAIATLAAQRGHTVGIYDIQLDGVHELAKELNSKYAKSSKKGLAKRLAGKLKGADPIALAGKLDVTREADWDAALADFVRFAGGIDVLVNNAGILTSGRFEEIELRTHLAQIEVNAKGLLTGCYKVKPHLQNHGDAKVINLSSASAIHGQPDLATYSATKFFVRGLTEGLDAEWATDGIRVLDMMPLFVDTAMVDNLDSGSKDAMGVNLTPKDVARVIIKAAEKPNKKWQKTHRPIGAQAKLAYGLQKLVPERLSHMAHVNMAKK